MTADDVALLTPPEREHIRAAVEAAERETTGEIVPVIVAASGRYVDTRYRVGAIASLLTLACLLPLQWHWGPWGWPLASPAWSVLVVVAAYFAGFALGTQPAVIRLFTPDRRLDWKVEQRARWAFAHHRLAATRARTAVLILVSLLEHRVQLLADEAIDARVPPVAWQGVIETIVRHIKMGRLADGLCRGIQECGTILAREFPAEPGENPNELPDRPIEHV